MRNTSCLIALSCVSLLTGCGDDDEGGEGEGCDTCGSDEVCVVYLGGDADDDREECAATPAECGGTVECGANDCVAALYGLCESGWVGVGCSPSNGNTLVSCNPEI